MNPSLTLEGWGWKRAASLVAGAIPAYRASSIQPVAQLKLL